MIGFIIDSVEPICVPAENVFNTLIIVVMIRPAINNRDDHIILIKMLVPLVSMNKNTLNAICPNVNKK